MSRSGRGKKIFQCFLSSFFFFFPIVSTAHVTQFLMIVRIRKIAPLLQTSDSFAFPFTSVQMVRWITKPLATSTFSLTRVKKVEVDESDEDHEHNFNILAPREANPQNSTCGSGDLCCKHPRPSCGKENVTGKQFSTYLKNMDQDPTGLSCLLFEKIHFLQLPIRDN